MRFASHASSLLIYCPLLFALDLVNFHEILCWSEMLYIEEMKYIVIGFCAVYKWTLFIYC